MFEIVKFFVCLEAKQKICFRSKSEKNDYVTVANIVK